MEFTNIQIIPNLPANIVLKDGRRVSKTMTKFGNSKILKPC